MPVFYRLLLRQDERLQHEQKIVLDQELDWLESQCDPVGPGFSMEQIGLVDCALMPFFLRFDVLRHYRGVSLSSRHQRLQRWSEALRTHELVRQTCQVPPGFSGTYSEYLHHIYRCYAEGAAESSSARDFR